MGEATIICPNCKKPFEISDAIQHQIEDELLRAKTLVYHSFCKFSLGC